MYLEMDGDRSNWLNDEEGRRLKKRRIVAKIKFSIHRNSSEEISKAKNKDP